VNDELGIVLACETNEMVGNLSGMVLLWHTILHSWFGKDKLAWIQNWIWMRIGY